MNNPIRNGNFTSSEIWKLMSVGRDGVSFGKPAETYIEEKIMERRLGRSLNNEAISHPLSWGKLVEGRVFDLLGMEYQLVSKDCLVHQEIPFWSGTPDANKFDVGRTVIDIKSPFTMKSFCRLVDPLYSGLEGMDAMRAVMEKHPEGEAYYWQIVSNGVLTGSRFGELIVYCPYQSELEDIREYAGEVDTIEAFKFYWISNTQDDELPFIPQGSIYKNINIIRFEIPQEDKDRLRKRVLKAGEYLVK